MKYFAALQRIQKVKDKFQEGSSHLSKKATEHAVLQEKVLLAMRQARETSL